MTATLTAQLSDAADRAGLSARLSALARLVQLGRTRTGPDGFREDLLIEAGELLTRAGKKK